jgi:Putative auto-transporter adhesin, head GIN domain
MKMIQRVGRKPNRVSAKKTLFNMKTFNYLLIIPVIQFLLFASCSGINGSGNIISKTQRLDVFTAIEIRNYCNVELVKGTENQVEYSDYENLIEHLKFEVVGKKLIVETTPENLTIYNSQASAKIYLTGDLIKVSILGSADVKLVDSFSGLSELNISGSGSIEVGQDIMTPSIDCTISGSGSMDLLKIHSETAKCTISGSGDISITVLKSLDASISGSGNIEYEGNPSNLIQNVSGSGSVTKH